MALNDQFFQAVSWSKSMEYLKNKQRNILGISTVETDIVWRYFVRQQEMYLEC